MVWNRYATENASCYWIAADADTNDGVRSNSAITAHVANGPVDGDNHEDKVVPQDLDYGLRLAHVQDGYRSPPP